MYRLRMLLIVPAALLAVALVLAACSSDDEPDEGAATAGGAGDAGSAAAAASGSSEGSTAEPGDPGSALQQQFQQQVELSITFTSPVFNEKRRIPKKATCIGGKVDRSGQSDKAGEMFARGNLTGSDAQNLSPPLDWTNVPEGTQSLALIVHSTESQASDEPWIHWLIWNLPADLTGLEEGIKEDPTLENGARQGLNGAGVVGYLGPCPPPLISRHASVPGGGSNPKQEIEKYNFEIYALDVVLDLAPGATRQQLLEAMEGHILGAGTLVGERQGPLKLQLSPGGV